jgi:hypothetical protein
MADDVEGLRRHAEERIEHLRELLRRLEEESEPGDPVLEAVRSLLDDAERR